jgi:gp16 family phage-associated protein
LSHRQNGTATPKATPLWVEFVTSQPQKGQQNDYSHIAEAVLLTYTVQQLNNCVLPVNKGDRMSKAKATRTTNVSGRVLSGDEAKERVYAMGLTLSEFASRNSLKFRVVSEVIRGVNKGLYGEGHKAAKALGMK